MPPRCIASPLQTATALDKHDMMKQHMLHCIKKAGQLLHQDLFTKSASLSHPTAVTAEPSVGQTVLSRQERQCRQHLKLQTCGNCSVSFQSHGLDSEEHTLTSEASPDLLKSQARLLPWMLYWVHNDTPCLLHAQA